LSTVVVLLVLFANVFSLSIQVEPKSSDCFYEDFMAGREVTVSWDILRGGKLDIGVKIEFISDSAQLGESILFDKMIFQGTNERSYSFRTRFDGRYAICFNNEMSRFTPKVIQFQISGSTKWGLANTESEKSLSPMEKSVRKIATETELLNAMQTFLRNREIRNRRTQESTNTRVFWTTAAESLVLVGVAVAQVYFLRRSFAYKRVV